MLLVFVLVYRCLCGTADDACFGFGLRVNAVDNAGLGVHTGDGGDDFEEMLMLRRVRTIRLSSSTDLVVLIPIQLFGSENRIKCIYIIVGICIRVYVWLLV